MAAALQPAPSKSVTESAREYEVFKYFPLLPSTSSYRTEIPSHLRADLFPSRDVILTALAQLAAIQTKTCRAFISLFDAKYQHCVAEATPTLPLTPHLRASDCPDGLWSCGIAIPRRDGTVCESCIRSSQDQVDAGKTDVFLIPDLTQDDRFPTEPRCAIAPAAKFYAAALIRSRNGINIGICAVVDTAPRHDWGQIQSQILTNISRCVMEHLEHLRPATAARRSVRMNRGIGSFMEGKSTLSGWRGGPDSGAFTNLGKEGEGHLNARQQDMDKVDEELLGTHIIPNHGRGHGSGNPALTINNAASPVKEHPRLGSAQSPSLPKASSDPDTFESAEYDEVFSRAANVIRESIEVEGCCFFDAQARPGGFSSLSPGVESEERRIAAHSSQSSEEDQPASSQFQQGSQTLCCPTLGFSVSSSSSIDGAQQNSTKITMPDKFLSKLLHRYPHGKIFNFNSTGELLPSDLSEEDQVAPHTEASLPLSPLAPKASKRFKKPWTRSREGKALLGVFTNARSVVFIPIWDSRKDRWYAGSFVYTCTPGRLFTAGGELSYLRAFGMLTMAEIIRRDIALADKAKMDALGSLSHELRSPLHGVVLGVELLQDTELGVFQGNILHTIETCGRTLVDTLDHLLDFSKVNYLSTSQRDNRLGGPGRTLARQMSFGSGSKNLSSDVRVDILAEEVVESIFAGFNFKNASTAQLSQHRQTASAEMPSAQRHMDAQHSALDFASDLTPESNMRSDFSKLVVTLSISAAKRWEFNTQPGAIRRIVMNLFGNALKYTAEGIIHVSIRQEDSPRRSRHGDRLVVISVADTGKGIGEEYLRNDLFKPFSQEDHLSAGTGLGLSLVKKIATSLGGSVKIESRVGVGTLATVSLPLLSTMGIPSQPSKTLEEEAIFNAQVSELKGLRVVILGFRLPPSLGENQKRILGTHHVDYHELMEYTCRHWLQMEVLSEAGAKIIKPDFVLAVGDAFERLSASTSSQPPCVVVCDNALQAYHRTVAYGTSSTERVCEFISQPAGPRKLAKVLVLAFNRWLDIQECPKTPSLTRSRSSFNNPTLSQAQTPETDFAALPPTKPRSFTSIPSIGIRLTTSQLRPSSHAEAIERSRYLLVDDNAINLKILVSYMKKLGCEFDTATNGQEAVDQYTAQPESFACILMDISMPVMDGFEATKHIRDFERKHSLDGVTIIALTGLASEDAQQEAYGSGIDLFLTKPAKLKELKSIMEERKLLPIS